MTVTKAFASIAVSLLLCVSYSSAQEAPKAPRVIVDVGPNLSARSASTLKTAQVLGGDGLLEVVRENAPKDLQETLVVILERADSNMLLTKFDIAFTIIYGEKRTVCEKPIETGFAPGGGYTINRPKVAFELSAKACLSEFFADQPKAS
jgi:hypothetical protein